MKDRSGIQENSTGARFPEYFCNKTKEITNFNAFLKQCLQIIIHIYGAFHLNLMNTLLGVWVEY